ncbi:MAG: FtsX-like permease family protein [Desulfovibrio sp.]|nr:FtsX-like permease family protein [Desulfovibrio sp.]
MKRLLFLLRLAGKSAWNRRGTLILVVFSILLSTTLLLGIEKVRTQVKQNFVQAVSGTDLVVGARGGEVELMLYAVFHLGGTQQTMRYETFKKIAAMPEVEFAIPISLGDSHMGYPVVASNASLFRYYQFHQGRHIHILKGSEPKDLFDLALGSDVAKNLGYDVGSKLKLSHGSSERTSHSEKKHSHEHSEIFTVTAVLEATGTPLDNSLMITLGAMEAIHAHKTDGEEHDHHESGHAAHEDAHHHEHHLPKALTATLVGLKHKNSVFKVRRELRAFEEEALSAVMPGVVMDSIWSMLGNVEKVLILISSFVTVSGLAGLCAVILAGLGERRRELAILRSVGARPLDILVLLVSEGMLLVGCGILGGLATLYLLFLFIAPYAASVYGIFLDLTVPSSREWMILAAIFLAGIITSLIPACRAYRLSLTDGLNVTR